MNYKSRIAFVAGPPVFGDNFFGRKEELQRVVHSLATGQSTMLIGQRRIGKSSILHHINYLHKSNSISGVDAAASIVSLDGMSFFGDNGADQLSEALLGSIQRNINNQPSKIANILRKIEIKSEVKRWQALDIMQKIKQEGVSTLLLFDEIDSAVRMSKGEVGVFLRSLISQGHLVAVCTSYLWPDEIEIPIDGGSPWYNIYSISTLGPLKISESLDLLSKLSFRSGCRFSEAESMFLIDMFGNNPFYLQSAGFKLFSIYNFSSLSIEERKTVIKTLPHELFKTDLSWHFQYLLDRLSADDFDIFLKVANGKKVKEKEAYRISRLGLISKSDGVWQIPSRITKEFLKALPTPSIKERVQGSTVWQAVSGLAEKTFEIAIGKAVETAAGKYF